MKRLFILLMVLWAGTANAATQTMSECSSAAWDTAYAAASANDTIAFPAGACAVTMTKAIAQTGLTILGAGTGNTTVTGGFTATGSAANGLRITGIKFVTGPAFVLTHSGHQVPENIRIDHNLFYNMAYALSFGTIESSVGAVFVNTLVDNNTYDTISSEGNYVEGDCDSTVDFPFTLGTSSGVYFEDNILQNSPSITHFVTSRCASRYVIRYNTFNGLVSWDAIDAHDSYEGGGRANGLRGSWTWEIYNNKFTYATSDKRVINLRGGQGVVFNNYFSQSQSWNPIVLTSYNICNEICAHDDATCSNGGWNDHINNTYVWGNKANCGADMASCATGSATSASNQCLAADPLYPTAPLVENTDFFLSALGGYTPYTYPHPLQGAAVPYYLNVTNNGHGTVTSSPAGVNCGATCAPTFDANTEVTLTATPESIGYKAATFGGDCSAGGVVTVSADKACTVTFDRNTNQSLGTGAGHKLGSGAAHQLY